MCIDGIDDDLSTAIGMTLMTEESLFSEESTTRMDTVNQVALKAFSADTKQPNDYRKEERNNSLVLKVEGDNGGTGYRVTVEYGHRF